MKFRAIDEEASVVSSHKESAILEVVEEQSQIMMIYCFQNIGKK